MHYMRSMCRACTICTMCTVLAKCTMCSVWSVGAVFTVGIHDPRRRSTSDARPTVLACVAPGEQAQATFAWQCRNACPQESKHEQRPPDSPRTHDLRREPRATLAWQCSKDGPRRASTSDARLTFHGITTAGGKHERLLLENFGMRAPQERSMSDACPTAWGEYKDYVCKKLHHPWENARILCVSSHTTLRRIQGFCV